MPVNWMPQSLPRTSQRDVTTASFLRANGFLLGLAALKLLLHLPVLHRCYHNDELYFIACGRHFSFGYVDLEGLSPPAAIIRASASCDSELMGVYRLGNEAEAVTLEPQARCR